MTALKQCGGVEAWRMRRICWMCPGGIVGAGLLKEEVRKFASQSVHLHVLGFCCAAAQAGGSAAP